MYRIDAESSLAAVVSPSAAAKLEGDCSVQRAATFSLSPGSGRAPQAAGQSPSRAEPKPNVDTHVDHEPNVDNYAGADHHADSHSGLDRNADRHTDSDLNARAGAESFRDPLANAGGGGSGCSCVVDPEAQAVPGRDALPALALSVFLWALRRVRRRGACCRSCPAGFKKSGSATMHGDVPVRGCTVVISDVDHAQFRHIAVRRRAGRMRGVPALRLRRPQLLLASRLTLVSLRGRHSSHCHPPSSLLGPSARPPRR